MFNATSTTRFCRLVTTVKELLFELQGISLNQRLSTVDPDSKK